MQSLTFLGLRQFFQLHNNNINNSSTNSHSMDSWKAPLAVFSSSHSFSIKLFCCCCWCRLDFALWHRMILSWVSQLSCWSLPFLLLALLLFPFLSPSVLARVWVHPRIRLLDFGCFLLTWPNFGSGFFAAHVELSFCLTFFAP